MSEIIDFTKNSIGNCNVIKYEIFLQIYFCARTTRYIVSIIIVSNCQHCDEQQFQTLSTGTPRVHLVKPL